MDGFRDGLRENFKDGLKDKVGGVLGGWVIDIYIFWFGGGSSEKAREDWEFSSYTCIFQVFFGTDVILSYFLIKAWTHFVWRLWHYYQKKPKPGPKPSILIFYQTKLVPSGQLYVLLCFAVNTVT